MESGELARLTREYGGDWGLDHTKRLLHLVLILADGRAYDEEIVTVAAYLHDWGGYKPFLTEGVDHAVRSREVAAEFLAEQGYPSDRADRVLECIACHHGGPADRSFESKLLTDADALDLLGVVGVMRICCMVPRDVRGAYAAVEKWREVSVKAISLDKTRELAKERIDETDALLRKFEEETFAIF